MLPTSDSGLAKIYATTHLRAQMKWRKTKLLKNHNSQIVCLATIGNFGVHIIIGLPTTLSDNDKSCQKVWENM